MADVDWKKIVANLAPTIGTMLAGPAVGSAISKLSEIFLGKPDGTEKEVAKAVTTEMSPDKIVELKRIDKEFEVKMAEIGLDYAKINQSTEIAYVQDTQDARKYKDDKVFWLGVVILAVFAFTMAFSLYGAYQILAGGITIKDVAVVAAVSGFIGSIIGYVSSNAQQVVGYFYGSSAGSSKKTDALAESMKSVTSVVK